MRDTVQLHKVRQRINIIKVMCYCGSGCPWYGFVWVTILETGFCPQLIRENQCLKKVLGLSLQAKEVQVNVSDIRASKCGQFTKINSRQLMSRKVCGCSQS